MNIMCCNIEDCKCDFETTESEELRPKLGLMYTSLNVLNRTVQLENKPSFFILLCIIGGITGIKYILMRETWKITSAAEESLVILGTMSLILNG